MGVQVLPTMYPQHVPPSHAQWPGREESMSFSMPPPALQPDAYFPDILEPPRPPPTNSNHVGGVPQMHHLSGMASTTHTQVVPMQQQQTPHLRPSGGQGFGAMTPGSTSFAMGYPGFGVQGGGQMVGGAPLPHSPMVGTPQMSGRGGHVAPATPQFHVVQQTQSVALMQQQQQVMRGLVPAAVGMAGPGAQPSPMQQAQSWYFKPSATSTPSSTSMPVAIAPRPPEEDLDDDSFALGDDLDDNDNKEERRKRAKNIREQKRAHMITDKLDSLKHILDTARYPVKGSSKLDILQGCDEYIQQLRKQKECLDMELKLNAQGGQFGQSNAVKSQARSLSVNFSEMFRYSHVPMCVVSIDGRIVQCNAEFTRITGYSNDKLGGVTLFSLASPDGLETLFTCIARLLSTNGVDESDPTYYATAVAKAIPFSEPGYGNGRLLLSLVRDPQRVARAFHCCLVPQHPASICLPADLPYLRR